MLLGNDEEGPDDEDPDDAHDLSEGHQRDEDDRLVLADELGRELAFTMRCTLMTEIMNLILVKRQSTVKSALTQSSQKMMAAANKNGLYCLPENLESSTLAVRWIDTVWACR